MVDKWPKIFILLKLNLWIHASSHDTNLNFFEWAIFDDDTLGWRLDSRMTDKGLSLSHPICFHFWVYEFRVGIRISKGVGREIIFQGKTFGHFGWPPFRLNWLTVILVKQGSETQENYSYQDQMYTSYFFFCLKTFFESLIYESKRNICIKSDIGKPHNLPKRLKQIQIEEFFLLNNHDF